MKMNSNDFGLMELSYDNRTIILNFLVFMDKFYAVTKKGSKLVTKIQSTKESRAKIKVIKSSNSAMVGKETNVNIEIMDVVSRIKHTHEHFVMVKNNYYPEFNDSLTAVRCVIKK